MDQQRLRRRIRDFQQAVFRLEQACLQEENEFIRDSVIQRFEFCYELAWKMLKLKLEDEGFEVNTPKGTIRAAVSSVLIPDGLQCDEGLALLKTLSEDSGNPE